MRQSRLRSAGATVSGGRLPARARCDRKEYQILFTSWSSTVVAAAVLAGMAVSVLPESALRPGMKVLTLADGFPSLAPVQIAS